MTTAPLLPAEAAFLAAPYASSAGKCLQAALLTLLGRDHIAIGEKPGFFSQRTLRLLPGEGERLPPHLAVLKNALASGHAGALPANQVVRTLQKWFGNDFRRYIHDHLAPALIDRGLLVREERKFLGLFPYRHYRRTPLGEAQAARLERLMGELGGMRRLIRSDPDRAMRLARAAGVLLVLSPAARRQAAKLKEMVERQDSGGGSTAIYAGGDDDGSSGEWEIGVEMGDFSGAADAAGLFDGIGAVGDFTGGDGGSGDGGDGGGGD